MLFVFFCFWLSCGHCLMFCDVSRCRRSGCWYSAHWVWWIRRCQQSAWCNCCKLHWLCLSQASCKWVEISKTWIYRAHDVKINLCSNPPSTNFGSNHTLPLRPEYGDQAVNNSNSNLCFYIIRTCVCLSQWLIGTVCAEPETVISRAWVQSPDPAE